MVCDQPAPIIIEIPDENVKTIYFQSIDKYTFYEYDDTKVK